MQHTIPVEQLSQQVGPQIEEMVHAIEACVHCGFCLAVCPTYQVMGEEMDSPRGRILLMKTALEGSLTIPEVMPFLDRCLGCQACVTACPSGVQYGDLITPFRAYARGQFRRGAMAGLQRWVVSETLPYPGRFRAAAGLGSLARPVQGLLPGELRALVAMLPERLPPAHPLPPLVPAVGPRRARVAFLAGCVQQVLAPQVNWATLRVLSRNGVEVVIPVGQGCCGALSMHTGEAGRARQLACHNLAVFPQDVDAVLTNAAGCGSGMKEYPLLFKGQPEEAQAQAFTKSVKDVSEFLLELGLLPPPPLPRKMKLTYHDACHLAHAQGLTEVPRRLLRLVPNLILLEVQEIGMCCGSAGTYNLDQPEIAAELGRRKAEDILRSDGEAVVTGNIGCMVQIQAHLSKLGQSRPVIHLFEALDIAYAQESASWFFEANAV